MNYSLFSSLYTVYSALKNKLIFVGLRHSYITITMAAVSVVLFLKPEVNSLLKMDTSKLLEGQAWRIFTSAFVHANKDHLLWNLITLIASGLICENINRKLFVIYLVCSMTVTNTFELLVHGSGHSSLGYSSVAAGSFIMLLVWISKDGLDQNDIWITLVPILLLVLYTFHELGLFGGDTGWELLTGRSVNELPGIHVNPDHLIGMVVGLVFGLATFYPRKIKHSQ